MTKCWNYSKYSLAPNTKIPFSSPFRLSGANHVEIRPLNPHWFPINALLQPQSVFHNGELYLGPACFMFADRDRSSWTIGLGRSIAALGVQNIKEPLVSRCAHCRRQIIADGFDLSRSPVVKCTDHQLETAELHHMQSRTTPQQESGLVWQWRVSAQQGSPCSASVAGSVTQILRWLPLAVHHRSNMSHDQRSGFRFWPHTRNVHVIENKFQRFEKRKFDLNLTNVSTFYQSSFEFPALGTSDVFEMKMANEVSDWNFGFPPMHMQSAVHDTAFHDTCASPDAGNEVLLPQGEPSPASNTAMISRLVTAWCGCLTAFASFYFARNKTLRFGSPWRELFSKKVPWKLQNNNGFDLRKPSPLSAHSQTFHQPSLHSLWRNLQAILAFGFWFRRRTSQYRRQNQTQTVQILESPANFTCPKIKSAPGMFLHNIHTTTQIWKLNSKPLGCVLSLGVRGKKSTSESRRGKKFPLFEKNPQMWFIFSRTTHTASQRQIKKEKLDDGLFGQILFSKACQLASKASGAEIPHPRSTQTPNFSKLIFRLKIQLNVQITGQGFWLCWFEMKHKTFNERCSLKRSEK